MNWSITAGIEAGIEGNYVQMQQFKTIVGWNNERFITEDSILRLKMVLT